MYIPIWLMWTSVASIATAVYILGSWVSNARHACDCMDCKKEKEGGIM